MTDKVEFKIEGFSAVVSDCDRKLQRDNTQSQTSHGVTWKTAALKFHVS